MRGVSIDSGGPLPGARKINCRILEPSGIICIHNSPRVERYVQKIFRYEKTAFFHCARPALSLHERSAPGGLGSFAIWHQERRGFVLLTGEVGTGKTTICRRLLETLTRNIVVAFIIHPSLSVAELLAAVCDEFGISYPKKTNIKGLVDRINSFLLDLNARRKKAIVIIDEAQNLSNEVLEEIRLLTNLETNERKLLQIILIGQPELKDKLAKPELSQLAQRIVARCHLGPCQRTKSSIT